MIKINKEDLAIVGSTDVLLTELGLLIHAFRTQNIATDEMIGYAIGMAFEGGDLDDDN